MSNFVPIHIFVLLDGTIVPVQVELRGDYVASEEDGTQWYTVMGLLNLYWTCRKRKVSKIKSVEFKND